MYMYMYTYICIYIYIYLYICAYWALRAAPDTYQPFSPVLITYIYMYIGVPPVYICIYIYMYIYMYIYICIHVCPLLNEQ